MNETIKRVISAFIFIPIFFFTLFCTKDYNISFSVIILFISILGTYELSKIAEIKGYKLPKTLIYISVILLIAASFVTSLELKLARNIITNDLPMFNLFIILSVIIFITQVIKKDFKISLENYAISFLIIIYCGLFISLIIQLKMINPFFLLYLISISWLSDTFAYFGGRLFGKHKINLPVSPNKTIEGYAIGIIVGAGLTVVLFWLIFPMFDFFRVYSFFSINIYIAIPITLVLALMSFIGDLAESVFKRSSGVKDSTNIIPGHGGILDVFDSLIYLTPIFFVILNMFFI